MALTPENFKRLIDWLHPDPEEAGREYERIRALLIRKFQAHNCSAAEQLADKTIDRVAKKLTPEVIKIWEGRKENLFFRVAFYILLEHKKGLEVELNEEIDRPNPDKEEDEDSEPKWRCLEKCLETLPSDKRNFIIRYYQGSKATKIKNREVFAQELDLTLPAMRVKALRIRKGLKSCILKCLANTGRRRKTE
jgi:DNA-directed RNA polymerase specialized sigma24 family protein